MQYQTILVSGANGLLGSNICRIAASAGRKVRGLIRNSAHAEILASMGVEPVIGDVTERQTIDRAIRGVDAVIHAAAVIGGTWSKATAQDFNDVNYQGSLNVLEAAKQAGVGRTVLVGSLIVMDSAFTITERSPLARIDRDGSPYLMAKLAAYYLGMHRACRGENICFVLPGAMYGPSPFVDRALEPTLFTGTLYSALKGTLKEYPRFPLTWPYVEDVARISLAALDRGGIGERYIAGGRSEDTYSLAEFCNIGCVQAGVKYRVQDVELASMRETIGSMKHFAERKFASPLIDPSETNRMLGVELTSLAEGMSKTIAWLREKRRL